MFKSLKKFNFLLVIAPVIILFLALFTLGYKLQSPVLLKVAIIVFSVYALLLVVVFVTAKIVFAKIDRNNSEILENSKNESNISIVKISSRDALDLLHGKNIKNPESGKIITPYDVSEV